MVNKGSESSEAFFENWACSEAFWCILNSFEQFWKVSEGSEAFSDVLGCSEALQCVLSSSEMFTIVLLHHSTFWYILMHSEVISWVLSSPRRFLKNLRHSLMFWRSLEFFWGALMGTERLWKVLKNYVAFFDVLRFSEALCGVVMDYSDCESFWNVLRHSLIFWSFLKHSHGFWADLKVFWRFWGVIWCSGNFEVLWCILICCERFLEILRRSLTFWGVLRRCEAFPWVFGKVHGDTEATFWGDLRSLWKIPYGSEASFDVLGCT